MGDLLVRAKGVSRVYRVDSTQVLALDRADFEVPPGAAIALTGQSGSGKTTLLHIICGLDVPTSGAIEWPALGPRESLRPDRIAISFQGPSLLPALSVAENVAFPLLLGGTREADAESAAQGLLVRMGLGDLAEKLPEELSGGQSQRVGLARALVARPALLLADEPTGQQDRAQAARMLDLVIELASEQGTAILVATHDDVAKRFKTRWHMEDGRLATRSKPTKGGTSAKDEKPTKAGKRARGTGRRGPC